MNELDGLNDYLHLMAKRFHGTIYAGAYINGVYSIFYMAVPYFWFIDRADLSESIIQSKTSVPVHVYAGSKSSFMKEYGLLPWKKVFIGNAIHSDPEPAGSEFIDR